MPVVPSTAAHVPPPVVQGLRYAKSNQLSRPSTTSIDGIVFRVAGTPPVSPQLDKKLISDTEAGAHAEAEEDGEEEEEEEEIPEDLAHLSPAEQQRKIKLRALYMMSVGTILVLVMPTAALHFVCVLINSTVGAEWCDHALVLPVL